MLINIVDIVDGALVNALALTGRRVSVAVRLLGRRRTADLTLARWFETNRLTSESPDLPDLSPALTQRLADILRGDEIQAALQELLAARLTDAPEADAAGARQILSLTLDVADADAARFAEALAGYYDDQICALVARLEAEESPLLAQIRSEAFSTRTINVLAAIERHTAALTTRPAQRTEASFLTRYRHHVIDQHGKLEPPDFDRRRRVPIADIYVPTTIAEDLSPERAGNSRSAKGSSLTVYDLAGRLDRSVLLGDPGGGKTTAANVLMHHFAQSAAGCIPFLVTLRDYAAKDPPERSVVGHVEHILETLYQCPAPPGLVDLLLLTGRAVVIFDGLDELLDTARRADVTTRVERFCAEYPLTPVLITSRVVGYDQARLDDRQFICFRLGKLADEQVGEFARKWFAQDREMGSAEADTWTEAFLAESAAAEDLRTNPLMLSLLCILYRGEGSLPRDRAEVYEQCAMLMFRRWDARRHIHQDLRAGHLLEPALRHLAWWLFTRDDAQSAVTERELVNATARFLADRGFESEDAAADAAREFVEFCRGRMWVFSDAGTTASGERLYAFTHRTFLEYFAAAQLAYDSDTPEQLSDTIRPHIAVEEWWAVAELAMQIKDRTSRDGAKRIYAAMLSDGKREPARERAKVLRFLALCLRSVDPSPRGVRELTRQLCDQACEAERDGDSSVALTDAASTLAWSLKLALGTLLASCGTYRALVADEIDGAVADKIRSGQQSLMVSSLRLASSIPDAPSLFSNLPDKSEQDFWSSRAERNIRIHSADLIYAAEADSYIRLVALQAGLITTRRALEMPGGPTVLVQKPNGFFKIQGSYYGHIFRALEAGWPRFGQPAIVSDFAAFGEYLIDHPATPWLHNISGEWDYFLYTTDEPAVPVGNPAPWTQVSYVGAAAILLIFAEINAQAVLTEQGLGPLGQLVPYLRRREDPRQRTTLPELPVPDEFKQTFRDWAERRVNFTAAD
jgi:hypothetical protein